jgi:hypothetical protein
MSAKAERVRQLEEWATLAGMIIGKIPLDTQRIDKLKGLIEAELAVAREELATQERIDAHLERTRTP